MSRKGSSRDISASSSLIHHLVSILCVSLSSAILQKKKRIAKILKQEHVQVREEKGNELTKTCQVWVLGSQPSIMNCCIDAGNGALARRLGRSHRFRSNLGIRNRERLTEKETEVWLLDQYVSKLPGSSGCGSSTLSGGHDLGSGIAGAQVASVIDLL